jgi:hypothetical protein
MTLYFSSAYRQPEVVILQAKRGKGSGHEIGPLDPLENHWTFARGSNLIKQGDRLIGDSQKQSETT